MQGKLSIHLREDFPLAIVHFSGELAALNIYQAKIFFENTLREGKKFLCLDFTEVSFLDSAGIGTILQVRTAVQQAGGGLAIINSPNEAVRRTLEISALAKLIPIFPSLELAADYLETKFGLPKRASKATAKKDADSDISLMDLLQRIQSLEDRVTALENQ